MSSQSPPVRPETFKVLGVMASFVISTQFPEKSVSKATLCAAIN